jgi:hypothetical protein
MDTVADVSIPGEHHEAVDDLARVVCSTRLVHVTIKVRALPAWTAQEWSAGLSTCLRSVQNRGIAAFTAGAMHEAIKFLVWESYPRQRQSFRSKIEPLAGVKLASGFYKQG